MLQPVLTQAEALRAQSLEHRLCFAAWPQTFAHASWFECLDAMVGMKVSRTVGRQVAQAERAVASALLVLAGAEAPTGLADEALPLWAMQPHAPMHRHLSTVAALALLPALRSAVGGAQARQWDATLGAGVRQAALALARAHVQAEAPKHAEALRQQAMSAATDAKAWEAFCLQLGLAALADHDPGVLGRVRLAWPHGLRGLAPLALEDEVRAWLIGACALTCALSCASLAEARQVGPTPGPRAPASASGDR